MGKLSGVCLCTLYPWKELAKRNQFPLSKMSIPQQSQNGEIITAESRKLERITGLIYINSITKNVSIRV